MSPRRGPDGLVRSCCGMRAALPHANLASAPNSLNVPAGLSDDPQGCQAKLRLRTRSAAALFCEANSSVTTLNLVRLLEPKLVEIATSAASRP